MPTGTSSFGSWGREGAIRGEGVPRVYALGPLTERAMLLHSLGTARRLVWLVGVACLSLIAGSAICSPQPAVAQSEIRFLPLTEPEAPAVVDTPDLLSRGQRLEAEHRWGEAVTLYEEALRENPQDAELAQRHDQAKLHYEVGRRYNDQSFIKALSSLKERESLSMYSEVLLKIQSHYVTEPNWQTLVRHGATALDVALEESVFTKRHLRADNVEQVAAFHDQVARSIDTRQIRSRSEAVDAVSHIAKLASQRLGTPPTAVIFEFICGATTALDEYSSFLTSDQLADVYSQIEGNFVGLGIELKSNGTGLLIVKVIPGSPAEEGGLKAGDRIIEVDGRATTKLSTDQAANLLQGEDGSTCTVVAVTGDNAPRSLRMRRAHVDVPSVDNVKLIDREDGVGYLKLTCFQKTTSRDLDNALWKLQRQGLQSLIIDLRGNPGGLLTAAVEVADKFVNEGLIVSTKGRSSLEDYNYTAHKAGTWRVPLVVLIDRDSASASEIFAGAIRDHHRGLILGERSFGKGSVQGIFPLTIGGAGVRLTTAKFYSPKGLPISKVGVKPDIEIHSVAKINSGADPSLASADTLSRPSSRRTAAKPVLDGQIGDGSTNGAALTPVDRVLEEAVARARQRIVRKS